MGRIKNKLKRLFIWKDWQDTFIFWVCAPGAVLLLYMLASFGD